MNDQDANRIEFEKFIEMQMPGTTFSKTGHLYDDAYLNYAWEVWQGAMLWRLVKRNKPNARYH